MFNFGHSHFLLPHHVSVVILAWELTHVLEVVEQKNGDTEQERGQDDQDDKQAAVWGYNSVVNFKKKCSNSSRSSNLNCETLNPS